jgi:hypothetical protein
MTMDIAEDWADPDLAECPEPTLTFWRDFAASVELAEPYVETFAVKVPGAGARQLARYWEHGEGATKVMWGTDGAMERCIALNRKHMRDPGGYCAKRHKAVTGEWPTTGGKHGIPS